MSKDTLMIIAVISFWGMWISILIALAINAIKDKQGTGE